MRPERDPLRHGAPADLPATGPRGLVPEACGQARDLFLAGRYDEALARVEPLFDPAGDRSRSAGRPWLREASLLRAWCLIEAKRHDECRRWLEQALAQGHLEADDPAAVVVDLNLELFAERYAEVQAAAEALLTGIGDRPGPERAELRLLLGAALRWQGKLEEALPHLEYACSAFLVLDLPGRCAVADNFLGWTTLSLGRPAEAVRWFEKSLQINRRLGATLRLAQNYQNLAIVHYKQGRYRQAAELLRDELELVGGRRDMVCRARIALGNVLRLQGDTLGARGALLEAYSLAAETGLAREEALTLEFLGDVFRDEGNPGEARRYYQRALAVARRLAPDGDIVMELLRREGECLDLEGRHEEALHVLNEALGCCERVGDRFEAAVTRRCLGVNAAHLGRWQLADRFLETAIDRLAQQDARHEAMIARTHRARLLVRRIDTGNAAPRAQRLLEVAWDEALAAQQLNRELDTSVLRTELDDLVALLARRKLPRLESPPRATAFSAGRAPATRVIAVSPAMQQVVRRCDGFARYDRPVLIRGEGGTGKELLARRLHENSPRGKGPFLRVGCTATAVEILANELFGRGDDRRPGLVGQAEGGTLLLTGVGDLPRVLQGKLLQLLEAGTYRPQGGSREVRADVRIVATSDADLAVLVEQGRFRADLHFKLRLMSVTVPPLRERPEDVMPLLDHFLTRLEGSALSARSLFDFPALEALAAHHWPGGTAELEAIAQQAWLNRDLRRPALLRRREGPAGAVLEFLDKAREAPAAADPALRPEHPSGMTWTALHSLIGRTGGNKAQVARNLGISRITLYRWLKQLEPEA